MSEVATTMGQPPSAHARWVKFAVTSGISAAALLLVAFVLFLARPTATLELQIWTTDRGALQLYWGVAPKFNELDSVVVRLDPGAERRSIPVPASGPLWVRMDPMPGSGAMSICGMALQAGGAGALLSHPQVKVANEVDVSAEGGCLRVEVASEARDPQLVLFVPRGGAAAGSPAWVIALWCVAAALLGIFVFLCTRRPRWRIAVEGVAGSLSAILPQICLFLGLLFGGVLALATPSGAVPDEPAHMAKVALVAQGRWWGHGDDVLRTPLAQLEYGVDRVTDASRRFALDDVYARAVEKLDCNGQDSSYPTFATGYSPLPYAVPAVALRGACVVGASVGQFVYGARLLNLLVALSLTCVGLRYAGTGGWVLCVAALLPMTLFEMASVTADSLTLGLSFCLLGLFSGIAAGNLIADRRTTTVVAALSLALAACKPGFAWVAAAFVLCRHAYPSWGDFIRAAVFVIVVPWLVHLWIAMLAASEGAAAREGVDSGANLASLIADPARFGGLLANTFTGDGLRHLWQSLIGRLGWLDVPLEASSYVLGSAMLLGAMLLGVESGRPPLIRDRAIAVLLGAGAAILLSLPLFIYWTLPQAELVEGLQGRYFIVAVTLPLMWLGVRTGSTFRSIGGSAILFGVVVLQFDAISEIFHHYYS